MISLPFALKQLCQGKRTGNAEDLDKDDIDFTHGVLAYHKILRGRTVSKCRH
jgi:hypothetical protein